MRSLNVSSMTVIIVALFAFFGVLSLTLSNNSSPLKSFDTAGAAYLQISNTPVDSAPADTIINDNIIPSNYIVNDKSVYKNIPLDNINTPIFIIGDSKGNKAIFQATNGISNTIYTVGNKFVKDKLATLGKANILGSTTIEVNGLSGPCIMYCRKNVYIFAYDNDTYLGEYEYHGTNLNPLLSLDVQANKIIYWSDVEGDNGVEHMVVSTNKIINNYIIIDELRMPNITTNMYDAGNIMNMSGVYNIKLELWSYNEGYSGLDWSWYSGSLGHFDIHYYNDPLLNGFLSNMFLSHTFMQNDTTSFYANMITSQSTLNLTSNNPININYNISDFTPHIISWNKDYFRLTRNHLYYSTIALSNYDCTNLSSTSGICFDSFQTFNTPVDTIPSTVTKKIYIYDPKNSIASIELFSSIDDFTNNVFLGEFSYDLYQGKLFNDRHPKFNSSIKFFAGYNKIIDLDYAWQSPMLYSALMPNSTWAGMSSNTLTNYSQISVKLPNGTISKSQGLINIQCLNLLYSNPPITACISGMYIFTWTLTGIADATTITKNFCNYNGKFSTNLKPCTIIQIHANVTSD